MGEGERETIERNRTEQRESQTIEGKTNKREKIQTLTYTHTNTHILSIYMYKYYIWNEKEEEN